jgi:hypothetical protein
MELRLEGIEEGIRLQHIKDFNDPYEFCFEAEIFTNETTSPLIINAKDLKPKKMK